MIVVVSDLHLQHTRHDTIRRLEGAEVVETRIVRNVSAGALRLLMSEIAENVKRTRSKKVELVLAGDIFEIHRTPRWFLGGHDYRPVLHPPNEILEKFVSRILEDIAIDNQEFFALLAEVVEHGEFRRHGTPEKIEAQVHVHYLPGNHDRLLNCFASTRRRVRELLSIQTERPTEPFLHELVWDRASGYGVLVRHGHEYDRANFAVEFDPSDPPSPESYALPALGDYFTVDIATRLAVAFRARYAPKLRQADAEGEAYRKLYATLTEFDDVRPPSLLVRYLADAVGGGLEMLRPVLRDVYETARADSFFVQEARRLELAKYFKGPIAELIEAALKNLSGDALAKLLDCFSAFRDAAKSSPAAVARYERAIASGEVDFVLAGHTHEPAHVSIPGADGRIAYFLDTGTWRTRIDAGEGGTFGRLRSYTSVVCYHVSERKEDEHRNFETWTGHLLSEEYGASEERRPLKRSPAPRRVVFANFVVQHVDEGDSFDGAELELHFGVDGVEQVLRVDGVKDGDRVEVGREIEAVPALDGEIWCWGLEKDLGDSILDRDDPLPWGVDFLERDETGSFASGRRKFRICNNRGSVLTLEYEVV